MRPRHAAVVLPGLLLSAAASASPRDALPDPAAGYDWKAAARKAGLAADDIRQLERDKILRGPETCKPVFAPYLGSAPPVSITSDSRLNAFHVLFEESVFRLERENAQQRPPLRMALWAGLESADPIQHPGPAARRKQMSCRCASCGPEHTGQIHFFRRKNRKSPTPSAAISPSASGYPQGQPVSGMCLKFIP